MGINWTEADLAEYLKRTAADKIAADPQLLAGAAVGAAILARDVKLTKPIAGAPELGGVDRQLPGGADVDVAGMNQLEARYAELLERWRAAGLIRAWDFEALNLRLGRGVWYRPDFLVERATHLELHETKGFWRDDARVKIKAAQARYLAFRFVAVRWHKQRWEFETFEAGARRRKVQADPLETLAAIPY